MHGKKTETTPCFIPQNQLSGQCSPERQSLRGATGSRAGCEHDASTSGRQTMNCSVLVPSAVGA